MSKNNKIDVKSEKPIDVGKIGTIGTEGTTPATTSSPSSSTSSSSSKTTTTNMYCVKCRCKKDVDAEIGPIVWTDKVGQQRQRYGYHAECPDCHMRMKKFAKNPNLIQSKSV